MKRVSEFRVEVPALLVPNEQFNSLVSEGKNLNLEAVQF